MKQSHAAVGSAPHPKAGQVMTGAEIIVQVLADEGVDTIFGYSGGAILPTYDAVFRYNADHPQREPPGTRRCRSPPAAPGRRSAPRAPSRPGSRGWE